MKRILAITFTLILVLAVLAGCMSPQNSSGLDGKQNSSSKGQGTQPLTLPSVEQGTQPSNPPSVEQGTQPLTPPSVEQGTQPLTPPSVEQGTQPLTPPSVEQGTQPSNPSRVEQETQPLNPSVPGEVVTLKINSLDKLNYYAALRMIAETPMVSKQSMTGGSPEIVLLAGGVGDDSEEGPTVPDATEFVSTEGPTVPDATELVSTEGPTVPDATELVPTEGPPAAPDNPDATNPGKDIIYYQLKPNQLFNMKKVNMFQIELTDENGFLASKLGLGLVDVVISEDCIWNDSLITFRNGDKFFSCLTNGMRLNPKTGAQQWNFSTHKYVEGFNIVKNFKQENYAFYIDADAEGQIVAFKCRGAQNGGHRPDENVRIVSATRISTQGGKITIAELEDYFNNGSIL